MSNSRFHPSQIWRNSQNCTVSRPCPFLLMKVALIVRLFRTYCANFLGKCQKSKARISKFIKFLNPKPHLFKSFNLVLIPSTIPLVVLDSKYPPISPNHLLIVLTLIFVGETSHSLLSTMYIYFLLNSPIIRLFLSLLTMRLPFFARFSPDLIPHESFWSHEIYLGLAENKRKADCTRLIEVLQGQRGHEKEVKLEIVVHL